MTTTHAAVPDPARLTGLLERLVACRTENPPGAEAGAAALVGDELAAAGFEVTLAGVAPGRANLVAVLDNGPGPSLAFNSHLDTVPAGEGWRGDPFRLRERDDGVLVGRGSCDAKGQVAAMVEAVRLLAAERQRWRGRLTLVLTADEEIGSAGARAFAATCPSIDRVVVGEPTRLATVAAHKGVLRPRLRIEGRSAHSGMPDLGRNAIVAAVRLIELLEAEDRRLRGTSHALVGPASLTVTRIEGGVADNIVPPACELLLDRRMLPGEELGAVEAEIRAIMAVARQRHGVRSEILHFTSAAGPSEIPVDDPLVVAAVAACRAHGSEPAGPVGFLGGCDLVHFQNAGMKGIVLGPGDLAQAHTPDEWIARDELLRGVLVHRDLALGWFHTMGATPP
jgi:acetylornithine deacetylase/succinyl-diaminopimelate desuccinylase